MTHGLSSFIDSLPSDQDQAPAEHLRVLLDYHCRRLSIPNDQYAQERVNRALRWELFEPGVCEGLIAAPSFYYPMAFRSPGPVLELDQDLLCARLVPAGFLPVHRLLNPVNETQWQHLVHGPVLMPLQLLQPLDELAIVEDHIKFASRQATQWARARLVNPSLPPYHNVWSRYSEIRTEMKKNTRRSA